MTIKITDIEKLKNAINSLQPNELVGGILDSSYAEIASDRGQNPDQYLIKGKISEEGWPFNTYNEQIIINDVFYSPTQIIVDQYPEQFSLHYNGILEIWSLNKDFNVIKKIYQRGE